MAECHKCPHQAEIDRLRDICSRCRGPADDNHGGVSFVSLEAAKESTRIIKPAPDWNQGTGDTGSRFNEEVPPELRPFVLNILRPFWSMTFEEWVVIGGKIRGMSDKELTAAIGWSKQRVWEIGERVKRKHARLGGIRTGMDGVRKGGRTAKPKTYEQTELFQ